MPESTIATRTGASGGSTRPRVEDTRARDVPLARQRGDRRPAARRGRHRTRAWTPSTRRRASRRRDARRGRSSGSWCESARPSALAATATSAQPVLTTGIRPGGSERLSDEVVCARACTVRAPVGRTVTAKVPSSSMRSVGPFTHEPSALSFWSDRRLDVACDAAQRRLPVCSRSRRAAQPERPQPEARGLEPKPRAHVGEPQLERRALRRGGSTSDAGRPCGAGHARDVDDGRRAARTPCRASAAVNVRGTQT